MSSSPPSPDALRTAFASLAERAVARPDCPEPDRLWAAAAGELPPVEARPLVLHTADCAACAEAWRLAREHAASADGSRYEVRPRRWGGTWLPLAAAVATVTVAIALVPRSARDRPAYRDNGAASLRSLVSEDRPLPRSSFVLRWSPGPAGSRYDVRVATADLAILHRARGLESAEHRVPPSALAALPAGATVLWQVEAVSADGTRLTSRTFVARLE